MRASLSAGAARVVTARRRRYVESGTPSAAALSRAIASSSEVKRTRIISSRSFVFAIIASVVPKGPRGNRASRGTRPGGRQATAELPSSDVCAIAEPTASQGVQRCFLQRSPSARPLFLGATRYAATPRASRYRARSRSIVAMCCSIDEMTFRASGAEGDASRHRSSSTTCLACSTK